MQPDPVEPSDFYTGLVAELYSTLRCSVDPDPLLELRCRGMDVEGLDSSTDMLDRCRARAAGRSIDVVLHHSAIETMDIRRRFRSIFLAGPTLDLIVDDDIAIHSTPDRDPALRTDRRTRHCIRGP